MAKSNYKPIIQKNAPGMDSPVYSTKSMGKKYGDNPKNSSNPPKKKKISMTAYNRARKKVFGLK